MLESRKQLWINSAIPDLDARQILKATVVYFARTPLGQQVEVVPDKIAALATRNYTIQWRRNVDDETSSQYAPEA